jgi:uncharacterized protein
MDVRATTVPLSLHGQVTPGGRLSPPRPTGRIGRGPLRGHEIAMTQADLIIVGASTRAAAYSARRAGFHPWCVDLFADRDLASIAPVHRLGRADYPHGLIALVRDHAPQAPLIYTGGLENHPQAYLDLARQRSVWGYLHPDPLQGDSIRNPAFVADVCARAGIAHPRWRADSRDLPIDGSWLAKPRRSSGGAGISPWRGQPLDDESKYFFQQRIEGPSLAATYVAGGEHTRLLGVTRQLVGEPWLHAPGPFAYSGSITLDPGESPTSINAQLVHIGITLAKADHFLRGLFGVDGVVANGVFHVIEVNPRYTASVEVLELATGQALLIEHARAFGSELAAHAISLPTKETGKAVYYAPTRMRFPNSDAFAPDSWGCPGYADVPEPGTVIQSGDPVLTILAHGPKVEDTLRRQAAELDALLPRIEHPPSVG